MRGDLQSDDARRTGRQASVVFAGAAFVAALACAGMYAQTSTPATPPDLSGMWKLNPDLSDKQPGAPGSSQAGGGDEGGQNTGGGGMGRGGGRGFGGGGRGMRGGMGGGRGGGEQGARRDPEQMKRTREFVQAALAAPDAFTIVEHDGEVSITDSQGQVTNLMTDGRKEKHVVGSDTADTATRWSGGDLVEELSQNDGPKISRTYSMVTGPDGTKQLKLVAKVEGNGQMRRSIAVTRVYDRNSEH